MNCSINKQDRLRKKLVKLKRTNRNKLLDEQTIRNLAEEVFPDNSLEEIYTASELLLQRTIKAVTAHIPTIKLEEANTDLINTVTPEVNDIESNFRSAEVTNLFDTLHTVHDYFQSTVDEFLIKAVLINDKDADKYVTSDVELNNNIANLKNELFEKVVKFLIDNKKLNKADYYNPITGEFTAKLFVGKNEFQNYDKYLTVIKELDSYFYSGNNFTVLTSYGGGKVPNIPGNVLDLTTRKLIEVFNAGVMLVNFDNIIQNRFSKIIDLDYSVFNVLNNTDVSSVKGSHKYMLKTKGDKLMYWKDDTHMSEGAESMIDDLTKTIVATIPIFNKDNNRTGRYMEMKDLYGLAAVLRNFELENFTSLSKFDDWISFSSDQDKAIDWYIKNIEKAQKNNYSKEKGFDIFIVFKFKLEILKSLKNYFEQIKTKELNSEFSVKHVVTQVLNNSYGATYSIYNIANNKMEVQEMYSHNAEKVLLQNGTYSKLTQNITNLKVFYAIDIEEKKWGKPLSSKQLKDELDSIQKMIENRKIGSFLRNIFGFYLNVPKINVLTTLWGKNSAKNIQNLLIVIREGTTIPAIKKHETIDNEENKTASYSEVIPEVTKNKSYQDMLDVHLEDLVLKPLTTIKTLSGELIPVFKLPTLTYNDVEVLSSRRKIEQSNKAKGMDIYTNLFTTRGGLLGTITKLESINIDTNKNSYKWNVGENFTANFEYDFVDTFREGSEAKGINVMIGNYADKHTILGKYIDKNITWDVNGKPKYIIGHKFGKDIMTVNEIKQAFKSQRENYYYALLLNTIEQYKILFKRDFLKEAKDDLVEAMVLIEDVLSKYTYQNFLKLVRKNKEVQLVDERDYSMYDGKLHVNHSIVHYYKIFKTKGKHTDTLFNSFVKDQEEQLIRQLSALQGNMLFVNGIDDLDETILEAFGIDKENFSNELVTNGVTNELLSRWLWTTNFLRDEYLSISFKGEYMHPHKIKKGEAKITREQLTSMEFAKFKTPFLKELNGRLTMMAKRNVVFTATIELPIRKTRFGITENVNISVIGDTSALLENISGDSHNQDLHDGSSLSSYLYDKMVQKSYPGKDYGGTKKQFGTFITEYGSAIKKDAETVLTNEVIRGSADSIIKFRNKQKQSLSAFNLDNLDLTSKKKILKTNNRFWNGEGYFVITDYTIKHKKDGNYLILNYNSIGKEKTEYLEKTVKINTLFDIWEAFGAEYSVDENLNFNEGSNELLYDLVTDIKVDGEYVLKNKLIHIISNKSTFKAGAINENPDLAWFDDKEINFFTVENRHFGPQLDASHEADGSSVKETTQMIAALAQNEVTSEFAERVYDDLALLIEQNLKPYVKATVDLSQDKIKKLIKFLSRKFYDDLQRSSMKSLAKTLAQTFEQGKVLPFSNQHFFKLFIKQMVTDMNNEFIVRKYSGLAAVLNPSHNIIQVYEDINGIIYQQEDILKEAIKYTNNVPTLEIKQYLIDIAGDDTTLLNKWLTKPKTIVNKETGQQSIIRNIKPEGIIQYYLNTVAVKDKLQFNSEQIITVDRVNLEDTITIVTTNKITGEKTKEVILFDTLEKYYNFKNKYTPEFFKANAEEFTFDITKNLQVVRNLKPQEIHFDVNNKHYNLFDLEPVRLKYYFQQHIKGKQVPEDVLELINTFKEVVKEKEGTKKVSNETMLQYIQAWINRNMELLDLNYTMKSLMTHSSVEVFGDDALVSDILDDVKEFYSNNGEEISNYKYKRAELILPNIYKSTFDVEDSMIEIMQKGRKYFVDKLAPKFKIASNHSDKNFKISLGDGNNDVYVKYVTELPPSEHKNSTKIKETLNNNGEIEESIVRVDNRGNELYTLPPQSTLSVGSDGVDVVYIKVGGAYVGKLEKTVNGKKEYSYVHTINYEATNKKINDFISSFHGSIMAITPILLHTSTKYISQNDFRSIKDLKAKERIKKVENMELINIDEKITFRQFKRFSGYQGNYPVLKTDYVNWFKTNEGKILNQIANKVFASWKKSHEFVAARIPSQSLQSFMAMQAVGYIPRNTNDAYVSIHQIWLQGSDYDIDKVYLSGYGFNKNAQYETLTNLSSYSNKRQLDILSTFALPTGKSLAVSNKYKINLTSELIAFNSLFSQQIDNEEDYSEEELIELKRSIARDILSKENFTTEQIMLMKEILDKVSKANSEISLDTEIVIDGKTVPLDNTVFIEAINKHNLYQHYRNQKYAIKNSIVSKTIAISSAASNFVLSTKPVSIDALHEAADDAAKKTGKVIPLLSPYSGISIFKQQQDAAVGNADVGIGANGMKVTLTLRNYYNRWYRQHKFEELKTREQFTSSPKTFHKVFKINGKTYNIHSISDVKVSRAYKAKVLDMYGYTDAKRELDFLNSQSALAISAFISGATDNAKELIMAKINAITELAGIHLYLFTLGFTPKEVTEYMNSDLVDYIIKKINVNSFIGENPPMMYDIFNEYIEEYEDDSTKIEELKTFKDIYSGAQEFKSLASILKVNQKTAANQDELNTFFNNLELAMFKAEAHFFRASGIKNAAFTIRTFGDEGELTKKENQIVDSIIALNSSLTEESRDYVIRTLKAAKSIEVEYINKKRSLETKKVGLSGGQFDFRYYINDKNKEYIKTTIDYYNLFKNTINIYDVLQDTSHYKMMITGLKTTHTALSLASKKYNFLFSELRDITRAESFGLKRNNKHIKQILGMSAFPIKIDEIVLGREVTTIDKFTISKWLTRGKQALQLRFDVGKLLKQAGISEILLFSEDEAKNFDYGQFLSASSSVKNLSTIVTDKTKDFIIDLTTDTGITNFRILMENILFKILEHSESKLVDNLTISSVRGPYGKFASQIIPSFPISQLASPINLDKFQQLLNSFNEVDRVIKDASKIKNSEGKIIPWKDLFFVYNLIINNERYGDRRLTPLFEDYIKNKDNLGGEYFNFSTLIDSQEIDLFSTKEILNNLSDAELENYEASQINTIMFSGFHKRGRLRTSRKGYLMELLNSKYPINTRMKLKEFVDTLQYELGTKLSTLIRGKNLVINYKCE